MFLPHTKQPISKRNGICMATPIKNLLDHLLSQNNNWQLQLLNSWPTIVGGIKTNVHILKIYENTLVIGVQDSCWLQELYLLSPMLIHMINQKLDQPRIKELRFKALGTSEKKLKKETEPARKIQRNISLNAKEQETLASISDEQLRASLKEYLIRCYNER